ncbi:hypothetical protein BrevBR_13050 [Brevundimonas sp. BR2-1]|uniref:hypothetical protein n=1 Tax=Brevundimonas sp. BR2-1 TaxID=3031123 RepID=UPI0030AC20C9
MPHQNVDSSSATAQNAATDPAAPGGPAGDPTDARAGREPRSYAASDVTDSSLAAPAAGEVADYMDEGDALAADDVQSGGNHRNRPERTEAMSDQGPKTTAGNKERLKSGSADGR